MREETNMQALLWCQYLAKAAEDHQKDLTDTGDLSAIGSDGSSYKQRIEKYCRWGGSIFQALDFGARQTPIETVVAWLVDDGNPKRTSRTNLLSVKQRHFAASFGTHLDAENCCVGVFAAQVVPLNVDDGDELGMRGQSNLPEGLRNIESSNDNIRNRKLKQMDWKSFATQVFKLQNKIRQNPKSFIPYLERSLKRFHGSIYTTEDGCNAIRTEEGQAAFIEAIEYLRSQKSIAPLKWSEELARAAKDHCNDLGTSGQMSSIGSGKSIRSLYMNELRILEIVSAFCFCYCNVSFSRNFCYQFFIKSDHLNDL